MIVYSAGPMRGKPEANAPAFAVAREKLRKAGHTVICPMELSEDRWPDAASKPREWHDAHFAEFMRVDLALIAQYAEAVALLPGWEASEGVRKERAVAEAVGCHFFQWDEALESCLGEATLGLSGFAGTGKDTLAAGIAALGWERVAFADALKAVALGVNPRVGPAGETLGELIETLGPEAAKREHAEVRGVYQRLGAAVRRAVGEETWVQAAFRTGACKTIVTDVRYPNEVAAIHRRGGFVVRIERPGYGPVNEHESEALRAEDCDAVVVNDGSVDELVGIGAGLADACAWSAGWLVRP